MSDLAGYINISHSNSYYFTNASNNDMMIYPETSNQSIHIGIASNSTSLLSMNSNTITLNSSNVIINGQLTVSNVEYITSNITIYNSETVQSNLSVYQVATLCNAVNIYGAAALSNGLTVYNKGTTTLSNPVNIYGATTLSNTLTTTGGTTTHSNDVNIYGNISAKNMGMFRNRVINGAMTVFSQSSFVVPSNLPAAGCNCSPVAVGIAPTAGWTGAGNPGSIAFSNVPLTSNDLPNQYGFTNSIRATASNCTVSLTGVSLIDTYIPGNYVSDLCWGTSNALQATLSFWLRTGMSTGSNVGVYVGNTHLVSGNVQYGFQSNVGNLLTNTWQLINMTIPTPPSSVLFCSGNISSIRICIGTSRTDGFITSSGANWNLSGGYTAYSSTTTWVGTHQNFIEVTGLQFERGTIATPFEFRNYPIESQLSYLSPYTSGNGYVGIGTTNPFYLLHVENSDAFNNAHTTRFYAPNLNNSKYTAIHIGKNISTNNEWMIGHYHVADGSSSNFLGFSPSQGGWNMAITAGGNVGIGATNPSYSLDIATGSIGTSSTTADMRYYHSSALSHIFYTAGTARAVINSSGVYPYSDNSGNSGNPSSRWGAVYAVNGTIQTSDETEKDSVPLLYGLDDIMKVTTIKYKWKTQADLPDDDPTKNYEYYGVCARELNTLFPELVYNETAPYQINYSELTPILINSIKDLKKITDDQATLIATQASQIATLTTQVNQLLNK